MKKLFFCLIFIPTFGAIYWYLNSRQQNESIAANKLLLTHFKKTVGEHHASNEKNDFKTTDLSETKHLMAKNGRAMTPEFIQLLVDALMKTREPSYRSLFQKWAISDEVGDQTLQIIRDRESQIKEALKSYRIEGLNGSRQLVQTIDVINAVNDTSLRTLLGDEHLAELIQVEIRMNARSADEGNKLVKKMQKN